MPVFRKAKKFKTSGFEDDFDACKRDNLALERWMENMENCILILYSEEGYTLRNGCQRKAWFFLDSGYPINITLCFFLGS